MQCWFHFRRRPGPGNCLRSHRESRRHLRHHAFPQLLDHAAITPLEVDLRASAVPSSSECLFSGGSDPLATHSTPRPPSSTVRVHTAGLSCARCGHPHCAAPMFNPRPRHKPRPRQPFCTAHRSQIYVSPSPTTTRSPTITPGATTKSSKTLARNSSRSTSAEVRTRQQHELSKIRVAAARTTGRQRQKITDPRGVPSCIVGS